MKIRKGEEENDEIIVINLHFFEEKVDFEYFNPMKFNDKNTITVIESSTVYETPVLQNGSIVIQKDDYFNPLFTKLIFERINSILCE